MENCVKSKIIKSFSKEKCEELNANELRILAAILISCNGSEFTFFSSVLRDIKKFSDIDFSENQVKGFMGQLYQKDYIYVHEVEWPRENQITVEDKSDKFWEIKNKIQYA